MPRALFYRRLLSRFLDRERATVIVLNWELRGTEISAWELHNDIGSGWTMKRINGGWLFQRARAA